MSTLMHLNIHPVGEGESLLEPVTEVVRAIENSGLSYQVGAMGTTVEGDWETCLELLNTCRQQLADCERLRLDVSFDIRRSGGNNRLREKAEAVVQRL